MITHIYSSNLINLTENKQQIYVNDPDLDVDVRSQAAMTSLKCVVGGSEDKGFKFEEFDGKDLYGDKYYLPVTDFILEFSLPKCPLKKDQTASSYQESTKGEGYSNRHFNHYEEFIKPVFYEDDLIVEALKSHYMIVDLDLDGGSLVLRQCGHSVMSISSERYPIFYCGPSKRFKSSQNDSASYDDNDYEIKKILDNLLKLIRKKLVKCTARVKYNYKINKQSKESTSYEHVFGISFVCKFHKSTAITTNEQFFKNSNKPDHPAISLFLRSLSLANGYNVVKESEDDSCSNLLKTNFLPENDPDLELIMPHSEYIQPKGLTPSLLNYQQKGVQWMLSKEGFFVKSRESGKSKQICNGNEEVEAHETRHYLEPYQNTLNPMAQQYNGQSVWNMFGFWAMLPIKDDSPDRGAKGILADEMGLGKTIEVLALILMNPCRTISPSSVYKLPYDTTHFSKATLIIAPLSILDQWLLEVYANAPHLKVYNFLGTKDMKISIEQLANDYDIVFVTYYVLTNEFHYSNPDSRRSRRYERKYERLTCALVKIRWWRVCLDEAQIIQSTVSNVAVTAKRIPRLHAWAITGTPVGRYGFDDLFGLFVFLDIFAPPGEEHDTLQEAAWKVGRLWDLMISPKQRKEFVRFLRFYLRRNTKNSVSNELNLPKQTISQIWLKLSPIEQHGYNSILDEIKISFNNIERQMKQNEQGKASESLANLNTLVLRLRKSCCHTQFALSEKDSSGPTEIQSMDSVLDNLYEICMSSLVSLEHSSIKNRISQIQLFEMRNEFTAAVEAYQVLLKECQEKLDQFLVKSNSNNDEGKSSDFDQYSGDDEDADYDDNYDNKKSKTNPKGKNVNLKIAWLETKHRIEFFIASCYHSLENSEQESDYYKKAQGTRNELLKAHIRKFEVSMQSFNGYIKRQGDEFSQINIVPEFSIYEGGIVSGMIFEDIKELYMKMDEQWKVMCEWKSKIIEILQKPLTEDNEAEATGEEYTLGVEIQEKGNAYQDAFAHAIGDRKRMLTGDPYFVYVTPKTDFEKDLNSKRKELVLSDVSMFMRALLAKLKDASQRIDLPQPEVELCRLAFEEFSKWTQSEIRKINSLERDKSQYTKIFNVRLSYYRALQKLSKQVEAPERPTDMDLVSWNLKQQEQELTLKIAQTLGRKRYFEHLKLEQEQSIKHLQNSSITTDTKSPRNKNSKTKIAKTSTLVEAYKDTDTAPQSAHVRECGICREELSQGVLTICGHFFCEYCSTLWIERHRKCPCCNQNLEPKNALNRVSIDKTPANQDTLSSNYSPDISSSQKKQSSTQDNQATPFVSLNSAQVNQMLFEIFPIPIKGSFGTKIDTMVKHIKHILNQDILAKVLIFSQWDQILDIAMSAMRKNDIHYTSLHTTSLEYSYAKIPDGIQPKNKEVQTNNNTGEPGRSNTQVAEVPQKRKGERISKYDRLDRYRGGYGRDYTSDSSNYSNIVGYLSRGDSRKIMMGQRVLLFKQDTRLTAFLLNAKSQSAGLTLTAATYVFLLEPTLNPSLELQAIGRVHRIGQTKETFVYRYLIENSIEEKIILKREQDRSNEENSDAGYDDSDSGSGIDDNDIELEEIRSLIG